MNVSGTPVLLMHAEDGDGGLGAGLGGGGLGGVGVGVGGGGGVGRGGVGGDGDVGGPERTALHFRYKSREVTTVACVVGNVVYCAVVFCVHVSSICAIHLVRL